MESLMKVNFIFQISVNNESEKRWNVLKLWQNMFILNDFAHKKVKAYEFFTPK